MKLTFDGVIEQLNEQHYVHPENILASALKRKVWIAEWHLPGCLSESQDICTAKGDVIECALTFADSPHGMKTALRKYGRFDGNTEMYGTVINTAEQHRLCDIL